MRSLVWFRRDLRIDDNTALFEACRTSTQGVLGVFVMTAQSWKCHDDAPGKINFWLSNLKQLSASLGKLRIPLRLIDCDTFDQTPQALVSFATQHQCNALYLNREYEVNETRRDLKVEQLAKQHNLSFHAFHDRAIVAPGAIQTRDGRPYSVFTPYRTQWIRRIKEDLHINRPPRRQAEIKLAASPIPDKLPGMNPTNSHNELWPAGESEAHRRLKKFTDSISNYHVQRDLPSIQGTSSLSPYLTAGVLSPRQCLAAALATQDACPNQREGADLWISELAWRDFYMHVLAGFPRVSMQQPFNLKTRNIRWRSDPQDLDRWKQGRTGYPIVDAGMRQLSQTGWMHNRLRMVTAMFLTKHLLIDWRLGEQHFMRHLIDGDLAANNGGWQWSASTGTDAAPYFRIFNPFRQSKRFDKEGHFIREYCPELAPIPSPSLHDPEKLLAAIKKACVDYRPCMVDHKTARQRALREFQALRKP